MQYQYQYQFNLLDLCTEFSRLSYCYLVSSSICLQDLSLWLILIALERSLIYQQVLPAFKKRRHSKRRVVIDILLSVRMFPAMHHSRSNSAADHTTKPQFMYFFDSFQVRRLFSATFSAIVYFKRHNGVSELETSISKHLQVSCSSAVIF